MNIRQAVNAQLRKALVLKLATSATASEEIYALLNIIDAEIVEDAVTRNREARKVVRS